MEKKTAKKIMKSFKFEARKTMTCPMQEEVTEMIKKSPCPPVKTIIGEFAGGFKLFIDSEAPDNQYAVLTKLNDGEKELTKDDLKTEMGIIKEQHYELMLEAVDEKTITGTLNILGVSTGASGEGKTEDSLSDDVRTLIDAKVKAGIITQEEADKKVKYMQDNAVDNLLIKRIVAGWRLYQKEPHVPKALYFDPYLEVSKKKMEEGRISEGLRNAASRMGTIYEGEKSVGKNVFADTIAWLMHMPLYLFTFTRTMSPASVYGEKSTDNSAAEKLAAFSEETLAKAYAAKEKRKGYMDMLLKSPDDVLNSCAEITGMQIEGLTKWFAAEMVSDAMLTEEDKELIVKEAEFEKLKAQSASVNIIFDESELYNAVTDGGVIVFNEMNMGEANFVASFCNPLLDGTGFLTFPGRGEVPINKDLVVIGTQNADYEGVEQQNDATMSRFNALVFEQPDTIIGQLKAGVEAKLKEDGVEAKLSEEYYKQTETFYKKCKDAVTKNLVSNACLNIRGCIRALTQVAESDGSAKLQKWLGICVVNTCPVDERQVVYATLKAIVTL